jgi:hypothetical protein
LRRWAVPTTAMGNRLLELLSPPPYSKEPEPGDTLAQKICTAEAATAAACGNRLLRQEAECGMRGRGESGAESRSLGAGRWIAGNQTSKKESLGAASVSWQHSQSSSTALLNKCDVLGTRSKQRNDSSRWPEEFYLLSKRSPANQCQFPNPKKGDLFMEPNHQLALRKRRTCLGLHASDGLTLAKS